MRDLHSESGTSRSVSDSGFLRFVADDLLGMLCGQKRDGEINEQVCRGRTSSQNLLMQPVCGIGSSGGSAGVIVVGHRVYVERKV